MAKVQSDFYFRWAQDRIQATYTTNQTLNSLIEYVGVDTSSNAVQIELPDTTGTDVVNGKRIYIIDQGNAETNNITVIPNATDSTTIAGNSSLIVSKDNGIVILELVDDQWVIAANTTVDELLVEKTASYTFTAIDEVVVFNITTDAVATLPDPTGNRLKKYAILNKYTSTADLTFSRPIDGDSDFALEAGEVINIKSDGTEYLIDR